MLRNQFQPSPSVSVREINTAEEQSSNQMADLIWKRLIINRCKSFFGAQGVIRIVPCLPNLSFNLWNAHFFWCVCHVKRGKVQPVFGADQPTVLQQPIVKRCGWEGRDLSKHWQPRWPLADFGQGPVGNPGLIVVKTKNKRCDGINIAAC